MIQTKLKGMGVALITPFKEDESVDYDALMRLVDFYCRIMRISCVCWGLQPNTDSYRGREENHQKDGD